MKVYPLLGSLIAVQAALAAPPASTPVAQSAKLRPAGQNVTVAASRVLTAEAAQREMEELEERAASLRARQAQLQLALDRLDQNETSKRQSLLQELESIRKELLNDTRRRELIQRALGQARDSIKFLATRLPGLPDVRLDLDLDDATPAEALKQIFERSKQEFTLEGDIPAEQRVTLRAKNIRLETALDLVTQVAGLGWTRDPATGKFRAGKNVAGPAVQFYRSLTVPGLPVLPAVPGPGGAVAPLPRLPLKEDERTMRLYIQGLDVVEERSSFNCSHCKGQVTVLRRRQQPRCMKCSRLFEGNWQFCPADGTKRPETSREWKYCPMCGKEVKVERSETAEVLLLGSVPQPGRVDVEAGLRVRELLERVGGVSREADLRRVLILHPDQSRTLVDLETEAETASPGPELKPGDTVIVPRHGEESLPDAVRGTAGPAS